MAKEVEWQTKIIKRIRSEGGYAKKWATQYSVGVPDLVTVLNDEQSGLAASHFFEVKLEKSWFKNTSRKIKLSEKQKYEISALAKAGARVGVILLAHLHDDRDPSVVVVPSRLIQPKEDLIVERNPLVGWPRWSALGNLSVHLASSNF